MLALNAHHGRQIGGRRLSNRGAGGFVQVGFGIGLAEIKGKQVLQVGQVLPAAKRRSAILPISLARKLERYSRRLSGKRAVQKIPVLFRAAADKNLVGNLLKQRNAVADLEQAGRKQFDRFALLETIAAEIDLPFPGIDQGNDVLAVSANL